MVLADELPNDLRLPFRLVRPFCEPFSITTVVTRFQVLRHPTHQHVSFLQRANRVPQRVFDALADGGKQACNRIRMAGVTAKPRARAFFQLQQHAVAFGTGER